MLLAGLHLAVQNVNIQQLYLYSFVPKVHVFL